jgi:hypothetical protein
MKTTELKQVEAAERQRRHDLLSDELKVTKLDLRPGQSVRERARLEVPEKRTHRRVSKPAKVAG